MRFRFLFVDDRGEEVYVSSTEDLARHVRSGSLREEALLYDSLTREWAPARTHPTFARFRDQEPSEEEGSLSADVASTEEPTRAAMAPATEADPAATDPPAATEPVGAETPAGEATPPVDDPSSAESPPAADSAPASEDSRSEDSREEGDGEPSLIQEPLPDLEPLPEEEVQVDTVQLFLKQQELERWEDERDQGSTGDDSILLDSEHTEEFQQHAPISGSWGDTPPEPGDPGFESFLNAQRRWGRSQPPRGWAETGATDASKTPRPLEVRPDVPAAGSGAGSTAPTAPGVATAPPRKSSGLARWYRRARARQEQRSRNAGGRQFAFLLLLLAIGGLGIAETWGVFPFPTLLGEEDRVEGAAGEVPLTPEMEIAETEAFSDMVDGMEYLRRTMRVGEPPVTWMGGPYLSNALAFPEVRQFWVRYREYVETLRESEEDLFRAGFVTRLRLQGVSGPVVSIRLARALRDFEADAARREATYARMDELAVAALGLHDFLLANAHRIRYAPVDQGVNDDPILEAVPLDESTAEALWTRIERLVRALDGVADADPLQRRDVSRSVLGSLALPESTGGGSGVR